MAAGAVAIGALASVAGLVGSWQFDTPAGPSIVVAAVLTLVAVNAVAGRGG
jgi:zinc transport system permease protein